MTWGVVIQELRRFHLSLLEQTPSLFVPHSPEFSLHTPESVFPKPTDDMEDWNEDELPEQIASWIEFHPVERALLEGPLLPIQKVSFSSESDFLHFVDAVIDLERRWLTSTSRAHLVPKNWEQDLRNRLLRLQTRSKGLRSV